MNQDSSFPPMLPPSSEFGALLFAVLPCLKENYRPLASFAYHMTELSKLKTIPSVPSLTGLSGIDALITDKDIMLRSLSFYGKLFRMPLLTTIATLLQGMQFYQAYKDILPGLFSAMGGAGSDPASSFGSMTGLFSGLGGLSPDMLSSLFSGGMGDFFSQGDDSCSQPESTNPSPTPDTGTDAPPPSDELYNTLCSFLTPEQQKIYEQLMHTD